MPRDDLSPDERWVAESRPKHGRPLLTTIIGAVFAFLAGNIITIQPGREPAEIAGTVSVGLIPVLVVWGVAYAATYRHGHRRWRDASFVIFFVAGALGLLWSAYRSGALT
jgi:hypothetical protein